MEVRVAKLGSSSSTGAGIHTGSGDSVGASVDSVTGSASGERVAGVVEDCVNAVGVDLNTASPSLLARVAGLNATTAKNIVAYREENGPFTSRAQLKKVPKLGPKAFEQCAGFLRIPESKEVLDNTGVHPESYAAAKALLSLLGCKKGSDLSDLVGKLEAYGLSKAAEECAIGEPTLMDIAKELSKPGRDPRDELPAPILRKSFDLSFLPHLPFCFSSLRFSFPFYLHPNLQQDLSSVA